jgi:hypothetical protein
MGRMPSVLLHPEPLTSRAQRFLAQHARVVRVDLGADDAVCRVRLDEVFGSHDDAVLIALRCVQGRYSGLTYDSLYMREQVYFAPVLDPDEGDEKVEFLYAVCPTTASGVGASLLPDDTVIIGWEQDEVCAFPSLDHLIECDALLDEAQNAQLIAIHSGEDVESVLGELRVQRPALRLMEEASGRTVQWWADDDVLVHLCRTWAALWGTVQPTLRVWSSYGLVKVDPVQLQRRSRGSVSTDNGSAGR